MEDFDLRKQEYFEKFNSEQGQNAYIALKMIQFKRDNEMLTALVKMIEDPQNEQELIISDSFTTILIDVVDMAPKVTEDDIDIPALVEEINKIILILLGKEKDFDPEEISKTLYEICKVKIAGKEGKTAAAYLKAHPANAARFLLPRRKRSKEIINRMVSNDDELEKLMVRISVAFHKLYQKEYGDQGRQYTRRIWKS